ncbi:MAG: CRISPR-associated helicase Cas3' [Gammaproteobacteria bacterium]|nr:CRISPR-associated helicase Cas3' [Gammaproteobacteria bacterium]
MKYVAHAKEGEIHSLEDHLREVAKLAETFAGELGAGDWAYIAGLWHDIGKYRPAFQAYIRRGAGLDPDAHIEKESNPQTNHASSGAIYAQRKLGKLQCLPVSYVIAGHHAGLPDYEGGGDAPGAPLHEILQRDKALEAEMLKENIPQDILDASAPNTICPGEFEGFHLWVRMLFSCLVDADFLDTERFYSPATSRARKQAHEFGEMLECFNAHMNKLQKDATASEVNKVRADLLNQCRQASQQPPGIFSMTIPTGGGKTLSSLAFALEHAVKYQKRRIIYAIPYTSIIDQTADVFREIFSSFDNLMVEHHSNIEPDKESKESRWSRLATENWDAPLVVTTTVQLFESLFAARTSRCRKLHNLVNSIIILDETQLLPVRYLDPIRRVIGLLSEHYDVTFVLSTATPTGLSEQTSPFGKKLLEGLSGTEIIENPKPYYEKLKRVRYVLPEDLTTRLPDWESLASELAQHESVLVVVNKRQDAQDLFAAMPEGTLHLSALMCAAHRSKVIEEIRGRLKSNRPTRVVSTQLVEAGVDLDFPVVYRALAGLDSIIQSAGRCNREGRLDSGRVVVFVSPTAPPPGISQAIGSTIPTLKLNETDEIDQPEVIEQYFSHLFHQISSADADEMNRLLISEANALRVQFRTAAQNFRMIDDRNSHTVYVRYDGQAEKLLEQLKHHPTKELLRELQRYSVTLYDYQFREMLQRGTIEEVTPGYFAESAGEAADSVYDKILGLQVKSNLDFVI